MTDSESSHHSCLLPYGLPSDSISLCYPTSLPSLIVWISLRCVSQGNIPQVSFNYLSFSIHGPGIHHHFCHCSLVEWWGFSSTIFASQMELPSLVRKEWGKWKICLDRQDKRRFGWWMTMRLTWYGIWKVLNRSQQGFPVPIERNAFLIKCGSRAWHPLYCFSLHDINYQ